MASYPDDEQEPPSFLCPISQERMRDPVTCTDGHSYDRANISKWLLEKDTSPVTGKTLESRQLIPNHALRNAIEDWEDALARRRLQSPVVSVSPLSAQHQVGHPTAGATGAIPSAAVHPAVAPTVVATTPAADIRAKDGDDICVEAAASATATSTARTLWPARLPGATHVAGETVLYCASDGSERPATVLAVHPGSPDDPEPYYTISVDGTERDTVHARLKAVTVLVPAAAGMEGASGAATTGDDGASTGAALPDVSEGGRAADGAAEDDAAEAAAELAREEARAAAQAAEEEARRMAVERSRLEARQARNERRKEAEAQAEKIAASQRAAAARAQADRARQQPGSGGYGTGYGLHPGRQATGRGGAGGPAGSSSDPWGGFVDGLRGAARDLEREWFAPEHQPSPPSQPPPPSQQAHRAPARQVPPEADPFAQAAAAAQQGLQNLGRSFQSALHDFGHGGGGSASASGSRPRPHPR